MAQAQLHCDDSHSDRRLDETTEGGVRFQKSKCENRTERAAFQAKWNSVEQKGKE